MLKKLYYYYSLFVYLGVVFVRKYALNRNKVKKNSNLESYDTNIVFWVSSVNIWLFFIVFYPIIYPEMNFPPPHQITIVWLYVAKTFIEGTWYVSLGKMEDVVQYFDNFYENYRKRLIKWFLIIWGGLIVITTLNFAFYIIGNI